MVYAVERTRGGFASYYAGDSGWVPSSNGAKWYSHRQPAMARASYEMTAKANSGYEYRIVSAAWAPTAP